MKICDSCDLPLTVNANGYWVGDDGTSDCKKSEDGHTVDGSAHADG